MGFFRSLKNWSDNNKRRRQEREAKKQAVNRNPTDEQLKNNKKGKLAYLWTIISIVVYVLGFGFVASAWKENIGVGIFALLLVLIITPLVHKKAINLAQEQRRINFYNKKLNMNTIALGLKTKAVINVSLNSIVDMVKIQLILKNTVAIITNDKENIPKEILEISKTSIQENELLNMYESKHAVLLSVKEVKGLEFDTVFVLDNGLNNKEKYIAYTRALSELYIVE